MGRVLITESDAPRPELDELKSVARVSLDGVYCFLYDAIRELQESTGQLIDPQRNAFFKGEQLFELERWLAANFERAACQSSEWNQRVGTEADGTVIYQRTSRNNVIAFLRDIAGAARVAHERNEGVLFLGE
jgi:hypothetical protein